jgi:predicted nucleic acid-binding protein
MKIDVFLDTNILMDAIDRRRKLHDAAIIIMSSSKLICYAAADSILTIKYLIRKIDREISLNMLQILIDSVNIVDTTKESVAEAVEIAKAGGDIDIEDISKLILARDNECEIFISSDRKIDNPVHEVEIATPSIILEALGWTYNEIVQEWIAPDPQQNIYSGVKSAK